MKEQIDAAIKVLKEGGVILYPTDTIWGLGCDATNQEAVEKIFKIKQRSDSKSLITLVSDLDMVGRYVKEIPEIAIQLVEVNDKPMTIIYPGAM
ncbi:MAG: Sua5/YciO/YrdC/YwlC family protein, partial [Bacteroidales bacterium]|nr:Sua5/YciO/YrdC/YwlC family protein [Bacteroidales bacterium]